MGGNDRINLKEMGCKAVDRILLPQVRACEHGNKPSGSLKDWKFLDYLINY